MTNVNYNICLGDGMWLGAIGPSQACLDARSKYSVFISLLISATGKFPPYREPVLYHDGLPRGFLGRQCRVGCMSLLVARGGVFGTILEEAVTMWYCDMRFPVCSKRELAVEFNSYHWRKL